MATNELEQGLRRLGHYMVSRKTIDRAIGMVMQKGNLSRTEAFRRIRQLSLTTRKPLIVVAQALLDIGGGARATD